MIGIPEVFADLIFDLSSAKKSLYDDRCGCGAPFAGGIKPPFPLKVTRPLCRRCRRMSHRFCDTNNRAIADGTGHLSQCRRFFRESGQNPSENLGRTSLLNVLVLYCFKNPAGSDFGICDIRRNGLKNLRHCDIRSGSPGFPRFWVSHISATSCDICDKLRRLEQAFPRRALHAKHVLVAVGVGS